MDRRSFLSHFTYGAAGLALACSSLSRRDLLFAQSPDRSTLRAFGYGELFPAVAKNTGEKFLKLPAGFEYHVIGKAGAIMTDGRKTPPLHDGMAAFKVGKELRIIRNHEVKHLSVPRPGLAIGANNHYDDTAGGGTTTLVVDPKTRQIVRDFVSLSGTLVNYAGGPTPWGSWISCEETTIGPSVRTSSTGIKTGGFPKPHGYCFEVFAAADTNLPAVPLKAMGRFVHEAAAVNPKTGEVYLTEDKDTCGFYRFRPARKGRLSAGGELQMLSVKSRDNYDTRKGQHVGATLKCSWVTIDDPDPAAADIDPLAVYKQGIGKGAATFARLEGCCSDDKGRMYFTATSGGNSGGGQIWSYEADSRDEGILTLLFESTDRSILDMPDNICLMPKSRLLYICEDSDYVGVNGTAETLVRVLTPGGKMADFAQNIHPTAPRSEFAGSTFSPDGKTLFVNLQGPGVTLAIWGDWSKFRS